MTQTAENLVSFPTRHCTGCGETKDVSLFYVRSGEAANRNYQCKECEGEKHKVRQAKLKEQDRSAFKLKNKTYKNVFNLRNPFYEEDYAKKYRLTSKEKKYLEKYGISLVDAQVMLDGQMGLCANRACGKELSLESDHGQRATANVDHCHTTGKVRGILCQKCNISLGILENKNLVLGLTEYLHKKG